jgi:hypothetical protein
LATNESNFVHRASPALIRRIGITVAKQESMKRNGHKPDRAHRATLAELVAIVDKITHDDRLTAYIVADLINTNQVSFEGQFQGRRVVVA